MSIKLEGLLSPVRVYYDSYGVPYIEADNYRDLAIVFGYIQARDRLFQMDLARRAASGRLSEIFGSDFIEMDKFYRIIGMHRTAEETIKYLEESPNYGFIIEYLDAYTLGVNKYIQEAITNNQLPVEYKLLGIEPEPWTPADSLVIGKLVGWGLSGGFRDLELKSFLDANGYEALIELDLLNRSLNTPILAEYQTGQAEITVLTSDIPGDDTNEILELYYEAMSIARLLVGPGLSNNWVISGNLTDNGYPILANDPHLSLQAPPVWYEATLIIPGQLAVRGVTFPGIPFIIIGRNQHLAWGFTNVGADVIDFYYYRWEDGKYLLIDKYISPRSVTEDIRVKTKDGYDIVPFKVNYTVHGPLYEYNGTRYAVRWTGMQVTLELLAFYYFNKAKNIYEFIYGQKFFGVPAQNAVIADDDGNIAYYPAGLYPIRSVLPTYSVSGKRIINYGFLPFNGSRGEGEWMGYIPFEDIPHVINPEQGFIVTANNRIVGGDYPYYLTWSWSDRYRHDRIKRLILNILSEEGAIGVEDIARIQGDIHSYAAEIILPLLIDQVNTAQLSSYSYEAYNLLVQWDYEMKSDLVAPSIYITWLYNVIKSLLGDEYEAAGIEDVTFLPLETLEWILKRAAEGDPDMHKWIDTDLSELITTALEDSVELLREGYGDNIDQWIWGEVSKYSISHPLGTFLDWLNYPDYPGQGGPFTVNVAVLSLTPPSYTVSTGPSIRFIVELGPESTSLLILPGGNNGNPFSPNYYDQLETYLNVGYKEAFIPGDLDELYDVVVRLVFYG
jgi:penicillin amidase